MNRVEISGGLTRDPELRFLTGSGAAVLNMTVAVNEARWSAKDSAQVVVTSYISCEAWLSLAEEIADSDLKKGDEVYVVGRLSQSKIEKPDGKSESKTRVEVLAWSLVRSRRMSSTRVNAQQEPDPVPPPGYNPGEEPF